MVATASQFMTCLSSILYGNIVCSTALGLDSVTANLSAIAASLAALIALRRTMTSLIRKDGETLYRGPVTSPKRFPYALMN